MRATFPSKGKAVGYRITPTTQNMHTPKQLQAQQKRRFKMMAFWIGVFYHHYISFTNFTASVAAIAPSAVAVTSCRSSLARLSPATNTPGVRVWQFSPEAA